MKGIGVRLENTIYLKTLKLFGNKGVRFTTEDLAKELGTSKRTIYSYFSSKDEIIEKTIDFVFDEILTADLTILDNQEFTLQEKIKLSFQNIPNAYNIGSIIRHMDDLQRHYPSLWEKVNYNLNNSWNPIVQLIEKGIKNKEIEKVDTVILRLMLNQTLIKLLDHDYLVKNNIGFDTGLKELYNILLFGIIKRKED